MQFSKIAAVSVFALSVQAANDSNSSSSKSGAAVAAAGNPALAGIGALAAGAVALLL